MFGRRERSAPLTKEQMIDLENMRDDCIALFINSGLTQKEISARGGPSPGTISKWLYKETFFPRWQTIEGFLRALDFGLVAMPFAEIMAARRGLTRQERLGLDVTFAGKPRMPKKQQRRQAA